MQAEKGILSTEDLPVLSHLRVTSMPRPSSAAPSGQWAGA